MVYKHKYKEGEIVTDLEFNEVFIFSDRRDGFRAQESPTKLRPATDEEKAKLEENNILSTTRRSLF